MDDAMLTQVRDEVMLPRGANYLELPQFYEKFSELFSRTKERFWKLECLQDYQEPGNPSYEAMRSGNINQAIKLIGEHVANETDLFVKVARNDLSMVRLRLAENPLTSYLQWEFLVYREISKYGQRVLINDVTNSSNDSKYKNASDFLVFDNFAVLAHNYDRTGLLHGAWLIEESSQIDKYVSVFEEFRSQSVPLAVYERQIDFNCQLED